MSIGSGMPIAIKAGGTGERKASTGSQAGRSGAISATCSADDAAGQQVEVDR
jgi:hypothetical protein